MLHYDNVHSVRERLMARDGFAENQGVDRFGAL